jgi:MSHA biogenesis protein MshG
MIARASLYPIFVMLLACGVFWLVGQTVAPQLAAMYADFGLTMPWIVSVVTEHGTTISLVAVGGVVLLVAWLALWWRTGAVVGTTGRWLSAPLSIVPGWRGFVLAASRTCGVRLFGVMLDSGVPLDECLAQSAGLSSSQRDREWAEQTAAAMRAGAAAAESLAGGPFLPPLVVWWLLGGEPPSEIGRCIRRYSDEEFARLAHRARLLQSVGPALATIAVGATAGACYGLSMFWPLYSLLEMISKPL